MLAASGVELAERLFTEWDVVAIVAALIAEVAFDLLNSGSQPAGSTTEMGHALLYGSAAALCLGCVLLCAMFAFTLNRMKLDSTRQFVCQVVSLPTITSVVICARNLQVAGFLGIPLIMLGISVVLLLASLLWSAWSLYPAEQFSAPFRLPELLYTVSVVAALSCVWAWHTMHRRTVAHAMDRIHVELPEAWPTICCRAAL